MHSYTEFDTYDDGLIHVVGFLHLMLLMLPGEQNSITFACRLSTALEFPSSGDEQDSIKKKKTKYSFLKNKSILITQLIHKSILI